LIIGQGELDLCGIRIGLPYLALLPYLIISFFQEFFLLFSGKRQQRHGEQIVEVRAACTRGRTCYTGSIVHIPIFRNV